MNQSNSLSTVSKPLVIVWLISVAAVSYFSLKPEVELPLDFKRSDLVYHSVAYLWLSFLPFLGFREKKGALGFALLMFPLGVGLELAQIAVPGRMFSLLDIGANTLGVVLGILLFKLLRSRYTFFPPSA